MWRYLFNIFNAMLYFNAISHFLLQYVWRMAYPMAWHRGTSHCAPLLSPSSTSVSVRVSNIPLLKGKYFRDAQILARSREKKEKIVRGSCKEKQKLQVFNSHEMTEFPPSLLQRDRHDWYRARYFCAVFLCSSYGKNQIESFSEDVAIGSLSRGLKKNPRLKRSRNCQVAQAADFSPASENEMSLRLISLRLFIYYRIRLSHNCEILLEK